MRQCSHSTAGEMESHSCPDTTTAPTARNFRGGVMIYELRTYTVKPGTLGDMVKAASTVSRDIRGNDYGKLEGYWLSEIGPLNQVIHLWSYNDFNERAR